MSNVIVKENETLDSALRRFKRNCAKAGIQQDISEEKQTEIIKAFEDNCNFDVFPITVLESSESEDN